MMIFVRTVGDPSLLVPTVRATLRRLMREGAILAAIGVVIGIGAALALTRVLRSMLFEVTTTDPEIGRASCRERVCLAV